MINKLTNPKKSIITTLIILTMILTASFLSNGNAYAMSSTYKKRNSVGYYDGKAACKTSPVEVYNFVHSTKFLNHTRAYKLGYTVGLTSEDCENWIDPGGPQWQHVYAIGGNNSNGLVYSNVVPGFAKKYINGSYVTTSVPKLQDEVTNDSTCAADPKTCVNGYDQPSTNWVITR